METLTSEKADALLNEAPVAHIGVIDGDKPYVTPMSFVYDGERIFFRTMAGKKLEAMRANPAVCIEVSSYDEGTGDWVSVIVRGRATEIEESDVKTAVVSGLLEKYEKVLGSPLQRGGMQPLSGLPHVIVVEIEEVSGMTSGGGWAPRTKPGRL